MVNPLRIFISSPADVTPERRRAALIIEKLAKDYARFFKIEPYLWETEPMLASGHFQDAILPPGETDILILVLWARLGTPLPEQKYHGIDGRIPVTGTEWEFETALAAHRQNGVPDLLVYRKRASPKAEYKTAADAEELAGQLRKLETFWSRYFVDRGEFRAAFGEFEELDGFEAKLDGDLRRLIERRIAALKGETDKIALPTWLKGSPFRGLETYRFEHAPIFFGRSEATKSAVEHLIANAEAGQTFLLVLGASGAGKSSLAQAGIMPALGVRGVVAGVGEWRRAVIRPGGHPGGPFKALAAAFGDADALPELLRGQDVAALARHLEVAAADPSFPVVAALTAREQAGRQKGELLSFEQVRLILVVDQLEELFTLGEVTADQRKAFILCLKGLMDSRRVLVIATMRSDYWHRAAEVPLLVALSEGHGRLDLLPPTQAEITEMIRRPAEVAGLSFETDLRSEIKLDAALAEDALREPGALPLLSFLLDALYARDVQRDEGSTLRYATMRNLGGLKGAIATRAEVTFTALPSDVQAALAKVLRALVTVSRSGAEPTARAVPMARFNEGSPERRFVEAFLDPQVRLLVADGDGDGARIRLAHEALSTAWERAKRQISQDRDDLRTRRVIEESETEWRAADPGRKRSYLLRDPRLANAIDLDKRWPNELDEHTLAFIRESQHHAKLRQRLTVAAAAVFAIVAATASVLAVLAYQSDQRAQRQGNAALTAQSYFLSDAAKTLTGHGDATTGLLLALEAISDPDKETTRPYISNIGKELYSISNLSRELAVVPFSQDFNFSNDGLRILANVTDYHWQIFDSQSGKLVCDLSSSQRSISPIFSGNGKAIGYVPTANELVILNTADCAKEATLSWPQPGTYVNLRALNGDGTVAVVEHANGVLQKWNVGESSMLSEFRDPSGFTGGLFIRDDAQRFATTHSGGNFDAGDYSGKVILSSSNGALLKVLSGEYGAAKIVKFSPDGRRLASATTGSAVCCELWSEVGLWDANSGEIIKILHSQERSMAALDFSPDGKLLVTASIDGTAQLWNSEDGSAIGDPIRASNSEMVAASFSPDGTRLLAAADDGTLWIRDLSGKQPEATIRASNSEKLEDARFWGSSDIVVTHGRDGTLRLWDARLGQVDVKAEEESLTVRTVNQENRSPFLNPQNEKLFGDKRLGVIPNEDIPRDVLIGKVRDLVPRCLTVEQRQLYHLSTDIPDWCVKLKKWPFNAATLIDAGVSTLQEGKVSDATVDFIKAQALEPELAESIRKIKASIAFDKGYDLLLSGKTDDADKRFEESIGFDLTKTDQVATAKDFAALAKARRLLEGDWGAEAAAKIEEILIDRPDWRPWLRYELARAYDTQGSNDIKRKSLDNALVHLNKAIENDPNLASAYSDRGLFYLRKGEYQSALAEFKTAIRIDPKMFLPHQNSGFSYYKLGDLDDASKEYTEAIAVAPANPDALELLGYVLFLTGDFSGAADTLARSVERYNSEYAMMFSFVAGSRTGRASNAQLNDYLKTFGSDRWPHPAMKLLAGILTPDDTLKAAQGNPDNTCEAHFYIGEWQLSRGKLDEATRELKLAADMCPSNFWEAAAAVAELKRLGQGP
jgi:WD40 repeat protein/Flp pilus assembly protein TadD